MVGLLMVVDKDGMGLGSPNGIGRDKQRIKRINERKGCKVVWFNIGR